MALVLSLKVGDVLSVGDHKISVTAIKGGKFTVSLQGKETLVGSDVWEELTAGVFLQVALHRPHRGNNQIRVAINAPGLHILRGQLAKHN